MSKIYIAAPLFTPYERALNARLAEMVERYETAFLPQRDGILIPGKILREEEFLNLTSQVFDSDLDAIRQCDYVLAILDGRTIDEGVSFELGYAHALGKVCIGFHTDARSLLPHGNNPLIERCLAAKLRSEEELVGWLSAQFTQRTN